MHKFIIKTNCNLSSKHKTNATSLEGQQTVVTTRIVLKVASSLSIVIEVRFIRSMCGEGGGGSLYENIVN